MFSVISLGFRYLSFCLICLFSSVVAANNLPESCQKLLNETRTLISEASKQPGTHDKQLRQMRKQLSDSEQQLKKLSPEMQQKGCEQALNQLKRLKQTH